MASPAAGAIWKSALIIGASSGIGEDLARQLAAQGCRVALVARREAELERIAGEINSGGQTLASAYAQDVCAYECVPALMQQIAHDLGGLDLVIYCAGVMPAIAPDEYCFEKDRQMIEVNATAAAAWLNEAAVRFERARAGTIVGISSVAGDRGRRGMPVYGATKAFLNAYLESLRNRLGPYGVTVLTVKPGPVDTPMTKGMTGLPLLIPSRTAAEKILQAAASRRSMAYVPGAWRPIMWVIRHIPSALFKRLNV